jgi:hypothetical protein
MRFDRFSLGLQSDLLRVRSEHSAPYTVISDLSEQMLGSVNTRIEAVEDRAKHALTMEEATELVKMQNVIQGDNFDRTVRAELEAYQKEMYIRDRRSNLPWTSASKPVKRALTGS